MSNEKCLNCNKQARLNDDFCSDECADSWLEKEARKKEKKNSRITIVVFSLLTATISLVVFFYGHFNPSHGP